MGKCRHHWPSVYSRSDSESRTGPISGWSQSRSHSSSAILSRISLKRDIVVSMFSARLESVVRADIAKSATVSTASLNTAETQLPLWTVGRVQWSNYACCSASLIAPIRGQKPKPLVVTTGFSSNGADLQLSRFRSTADVPLVLVTVCQRVDRLSMVVCRFVCRHHWFLQ